jgi:hypothetical protein
LDFKESKEEGGEKIDYRQFFTLVSAVLIAVTVLAVSAQSITDNSTADEAPTYNRSLVIIRHPGALQ